ncbi:aldehyde dehydrogenase family 1 member A3 [Lates japonicus]|uniref:Aldehyde dehydrogenase family 1 member A3 n=1 Tax=Lates japonicus TaxID=270547 RepID=A0AAD3NDZ9_LATJO|nr:aldehyde dehydrogenase family 1 member A3 [Lates japonicus]
MNRRSELGDVLEQDDSLQLMGLFRGLWEVHAWAGAELGSLQPLCERRLHGYKNTVELGTRASSGELTQNGTERNIQRTGRRGQGGGGSQAARQRNLWENGRVHPPRRLLHKLADLMEGPLLLAVGSSQFNIFLQTFSNNVLSRAKVKGMCRTMILVFLIPQTHRDSRQEALPQSFYIDLDGSIKTLRYYAGWAATRSMARVCL